MVEGMKTKSITDFSMDVFSLKGKAAMVTGANQGLGMGYALAFAKAGADIFIPHLTDDIAEIKQLVEQCGQRVHFSQGDLTDHAYCDGLLDECLKEFGKIDILVNNAGFHIFNDFFEYKDEDFRRVVELNMNVTYYLGARVGRWMAKNGGGKIINIASALSFTADRKCPPYVASKHGVVGITRDFANELGPYNVQCNAIAPGFYATECNKDVTDDAFYEHIQERVPAGRWGVAYDLMGTALFLASGASDYINGWVVNVDGGFTTKL